MSLLKSIGNVFKSVASVAAPALGTFLGGPIGGIVGGAIGSIIGPKAVPTPGVASAGMFPGLALPALRTGAASLVGGAVRVGVSGAKRVYSAASGYCRKHPQWCSTIGGIAAVEALINSGQLPIPKRRRAKGISGTELKNFRRVAKFTSQYCAPVRRAMSTKAVRRGARSCQ